MATIAKAGSDTRFCCCTDQGLELQNICSREQFIYLQCQGQAAIQNFGILSHDCVRVVNRTHVHLSHRNELYIRSTSRIIFNSV